MESDNDSLVFEEVEVEEARNGGDTCHVSVVVDNHKKKKSAAATASINILDEKEEDDASVSASVTGSSVLRRRRIETRSSFLSDSYALIDSLQQKQQQEEASQQGAGAGGRDDHSTSSKRLAYTNRDVASILSFTSTELQKQEEGTTAATATTNTTTTTTTPNPRSLDVMNQPFTSSLRRSVQVMQRQSTIRIKPVTQQQQQQQQLQQKEKDNADETTIPGAGQNQIPEGTPDTETASPTTSTSRRAASFLLASSVFHLSAFAILGASTRVFVGWLFSGAGGEDCDNHSNNNNNPWCVTSSDGALFADLPANMLGSFLMGLLQKPSHELRLVAAPDMAVAFLPSSHWFQRWGVVHIMALRTGFCGSLTTFASWNTQMVRLLDGTAVTQQQQSGSSSQYVSAIFGYILGLQAALASLHFGQTVAVWLYRYMNRALAKEEDVLMYAYAKETTTAGAGEVDGDDYDDDDSYYHKTDKALPDYEMRYLASLFPNEELRWAMQNVNILESLERWKVSTDQTRLCGDPHDKYLRGLHQIEEAILVDEEEPANDYLEMAKDMGWDVAALRKFASDAHGVSVSATNNKMSNRNERTNIQTLGFAVLATLPFLLAGGLVLVLIVLNVISEDGDTMKISYQKQWLSALFAPFGALLRWKLSRFNGTLNGYWYWFPLGTFIANILASIISATVAGVTDSGWVEEGVDTLLEAVLYGIKTGFAGSLSTVSSFVAEGFTLQSTYPHHAKAYYYMVGSLLLACAVGLVCYAPLVRTGPA